MRLSLTYLNLSNLDTHSKSPRGPYIFVQAMTSTITCVGTSSRSLEPSLYIERNHGIFTLIFSHGYSLYMVLTFQNSCSMSPMIIVIFVVGVVTIDMVYESSLLVIVTIVRSITRLSCVLQVRSLRLWIAIVPVYFRYDHYVRGLPLLWTAIVPLRWFPAYSLDH